MSIFKKKEIFNSKTVKKYIYFRDKYQYDFAERADSPNTHIHDRSSSWLIFGV
jgi:hypothetical protein